LPKISWKATALGQQLPDTAPQSMSCVADWSVEREQIEAMEMHS